MRGLSSVCFIIIRPALIRTACGLSKDVGVRIAIVCMNKVRGGWDMACSAPGEIGASQS